MNKEKLTKRRRFTQEEKRRILAKTACRCGHCGINQKEFEATIDHIIPLNKGGLNDEYNLIALCETCNGEKANFLYSVADYYKYILPEYMEKYYSYHRFAMYNKSRGLLFEHDAHEYTIYPEKQKMILYQMVKRGVSKKKLNDMKDKLGVRLYIQRAYEGDADEIMKLINTSIKKENLHVCSSYYQNDYSVVDDIKNGEVYVLSTKNRDKICGAFLFKKINDDTLPFVQIKNIIDQSTLHAKYIMTGAFVDYFANEAFNDIMTDIVKSIIKNKGIPIFFNILKYMFSDVNECISIPYEMDGQNGTIEFMPMKYIRKIIREDCKFISDTYKEDLDENELDIFTDAVINYVSQKEIEEESDEATKELFQKHESLKIIFKPKECELYACGFLEENKEGDINCQ